MTAALERGEGLAVARRAKHDGATIFGTFILGKRSGTFGLTRWETLRVETLEHYLRCVPCCPGPGHLHPARLGHPRTLNYVDYKTGDLGDNDSYLPVSESISAFERAMARANNQDYVVKIYPKCNLGLIVSETGSTSTGGKERNFSPG